MKKFIIAMIAVVLGLSSCSKESQLLGSWKLETIKMQNVTINAAEAEMDLTLTFKDGGTVVYTQSGYSENCSYTIKGNKLNIDGEEFEFEVKSKKLTLKGNFEIGDAAGAQATATFKKL